MPKRMKLALAGCLVLAGCEFGAVPPAQVGILGYATTPSYDRVTAQMRPAPVTRVTASSTNPAFPLRHLTDGNLASAWGPAATDPQPTLTFPLPPATTLTGMAIKMSPEGISVDVQVRTPEGWETVLEDLRPEVATMDWVALPYVEGSEVRLVFGGVNVSRLLVCEVQFFDRTSVQPAPRPTAEPSPLPTVMPRPVPSLPPSFPQPTPTVPGESPSPLPTSSPGPVPSPTPTVTPSPLPSEPPVEDCGCFVTGGGWLDGNRKVSFGFVAMSNPGRGFTGNLQINDHDTKARYHGRVTAVSCGDDSATFSGTLDSGGTFMVTVTDNGEPGVNDTFAFSTDAGIELSGELGGDRPGGGNIQLHESCD